MFAVAVLVEIVERAAAGAVVDLYALISGIA
jgi:hypothetical protein